MVCCGRLFTAAVPAPFRFSFRETINSATASRIMKSANPPRMRRINRVRKRSVSMAVLAAAGVKGSRPGIDDDAADFTDGHTVHDATDHFAALTRGKTDFQLDSVVFVSRQAANDGCVS